MDISTISLLEACQEHCFHKRVDKSDRSILDIDISDWLQVLINHPQEILRKYLNDFKHFHLIFKNIKLIDHNTCNVIAQLLGPRVIEITFKKCSGLKWNEEIKKIIANSKFIESLKLIDNSWVDDYVMEQLSVRYKKSIKHLELENSAISDSALFQFGRRCTTIQTFSLICCSKITDVGLSEIAKNNHISILNLSHNFKITDKGVENLISNACNLQSVVLVNNPLLTDQSLAALYEANAPWGKKRNVESQPITKLDIKFSPNFTAQSLVWISACLPNLNLLDMRECVGIDLVKGISEIISMQKITDLRIGPSKESKIFNIQRFLQAMMYQAPQLITLHLIGLKGCTDSHIGELIENSPNLNNIILQDLEFASLTIESICSNIPNITSLQLMGSHIFADIDLRCLTTICRNLIELTIQRCPKLSDAGFTRFVSLKQLELLNLSNCAPRGQCSGGIMKFLSVSPLTSLYLDGLKLNVREVFPCLMNSTTTRLTTLSIRQCAGVTMDDIVYLLSMYLRCSTIDCSECPNLPPHAIRFHTSHSNPFLVYEYKPDFCGYTQTDHLRSLYIQFWSQKQQLRRHYGARLMQNLRRRYLKRILDLKQERRERWSSYKIKQLTIIQAHIRSYFIRKTFKTKLMTGRRLVRAGRDYLFYKDYLKSKFYIRYYRTQLVKVCFQKLKLNMDLSLSYLKPLRNELQTRKRCRDLKINFKILQFMQVELKEKAFEDSASAFFEVKFLTKIIICWKKIIFETSSRKQRLVHMFLHCVPLSTYNSAGQLNNRQVAESFYKQRIMMSAWMTLAKDLMEIRKSNSLIPLAINHADKSFFNRVVGKCFGSFNIYREDRKRKRAAKLLADVHHDKYSKMSGCKSLWDRMGYIRTAKALMKTAYPKRRSLLIKQGISKRFPVHTLYTIHFKDQRKRSIIYFNQRICTLGFDEFKIRIVKSKEFRIMWRKAEMNSDFTYQSKTYRAWSIFAKNNKNMGSFYFLRYLQKIQRKMLYALIFNRSLGKNYVQTIKLECERKLKSPDGFFKVVKFIKKFQAVIRARKVRREYQEIKIQKLYAIQVLQNFFRTILARKEYTSRFRKQLIGEVVNELKEQELMRLTELEMMYYNYQIKAITNFQRIFRGWKARVLAGERAVIYYRDVSKDYYTQNKLARLKHEAFKRSQIAKDHQRVLSCIDIQKVGRGYIARKYVRRLKHVAKTAKYAVYVQRDYRRRLAKLKLQGMKRDKNNELRFKAARKQRGSVLRLFGFKNRKQQAKAAVILNELGLDPLSFNYRIKELYQDTVKDCITLWNIFQRENLLLNQNGFNRLALTVGRRRILVSQGVKIQVQDAVKIIEEGHKYVGYTGRVTRIDESLFGYPLYEVKLDRIPRLTFTRMTTDALFTYLNPQPMSKIERIQELEEFVPRKVIFGIDAEDPFYCKKNVNAAWTIERAFRMHRARKAVDRIRYELWLRSTARQWSLYNHLAETNTITTQAHNVTGILKIRPPQTVFFDEVRHFFFPDRFSNNVKKTSEKVSIKREFLHKCRDRITFLQKCAIIAGKEYFATGYERMTVNRKLLMFLRGSFGVLSKGSSNIRGIFGSKGAKVLSKQAPLVTGLDKHCFEQFIGSPHVRYPKVSLFQGEWSGIPFITPLKPHGPGLVVFLDGWGFAKEDKVLYLQIVKCRYLNAMDFDTSDPYCEIYCNGIFLQTTIKWRNLNPDYYESFEIDVTNPSAELNIVVKDKDYLGSDDFMGQILLKLSEYEDGKEVEQTHLLKGEDINITEDTDRGEISIRLRWAERKFEDDQAKEAMKLLKAIRLQAWARRISALMKSKKMRRQRFELLQMVRMKAIVITNTCRIRLARKELKRRMRLHKSAIKIQKRIRIWIAKKVFARKLLRRDAAIVIQTLMRICLAKAIVVRMREKENADLAATATNIQKNARRMIVRCAVVRRKAEKSAKIQRLRELAAEEGEVYVEEAPPPILSWLATYGVDPDYRLKRNRRITERLFQRILRTKFVRMKTKLGLVYVESYPPKKSEEEMLNELQEGVKESLTIRKDFVAVYFPTFMPTSLHRKQVIERCNKIAHIAYLHIPTTIAMRATVDYNVSTIQCLQRQRLARRARDKMIRVHKAIALFQRIFRMRYEIFHKSSIRISSLFRAIKAKNITAILRREKNAAWKIQSGFRCHIARSIRFDLYCVSELSVLKYSPSFLEFHGPEKALEHREDTFWVAETSERAEIRVEFAKIETITEIWIMTSTYSASPNYVSIYTVPNKQRNYVELVDRSELQLLKQYRWHKISLNFTVSKYFKLVFQDNYGDEKYISVKQIRFLRSKEKSAMIVKQPLQYIMERGPSVGDTGNLVLKCIAEGWPTPTYQWYKGTNLIPGEITPELRLQLQCPTYGSRSYRCLKCKMVSTQVPFNAFHIQCGNCSKLFPYKDIEDYDIAIEKVKNKDKIIIDQINALITSRIQLEGFKNEKYVPMIADLNERIKKLEDDLQVLRESRIDIKQRVNYCNLFTDEGVYFCLVQNFRGGTMKMVRKSVGAVVVVEHSIPYIVEVGPVYVPRVQTIRKKWNIYASIQGTFSKGRLEGLVVIRFNDGSFYEGPYVPESAIDHLGKSLPEGRAKNHYGIFKLKDGRIFEGNNVDNHFDQRNLNSFYRMTLPNNKGIYEGYFCDEMFHGTGMFTYEDGSVYEGHWFRGTCFGHGHFRSISEGWTYEGFFDTDRKHRHGVINWPNGACYMGEWYYDDIKGKGIFITPLRDVYRGELQNKLFHGKGELIYADASRYVGDFKEGLRHGQGIFTDRVGHEYYGNFINDVMHGEHVVKLIIETEEIGQSNYEIRVGQYNDGKLIKWKSKFSNPVATKQFIKLFKKNREMFDSVYSMILAKNLPALPDGIDANNEHVKTIVYKIRQEAGMLVGEHALNQAMSQLNALLKPVGDKKELIDTINHEIEHLSVTKIANEKEAHKIYVKFTTLMSRYEKDFQKIEQYWMDDPTEVRPRFNLACKALDTLSVDDYFSFRNHRVVPPFVKKIVDAISCLLNLDFEWKAQQFIIADAISNGRNGDDKALRLNYKCKLSHIMKTSYQVYDYAFFKNTELMDIILADTRFHRDSYYIQSTGPCGPILVDWIKTNYQYTRAAKNVYDQLHKAEELKTSAYRAKSVHLKKQEEIVELESRIVTKKAQLKSEQLELDDLQHGLLKANDLLEFISGRYQFGQNDGKQDYYKLFEQRLEAKRDLFTVEVCLQGIINGVLNIAEKEKQQKVRETLANGKKWVEPVIDKPQLKDWIEEEVLSQQANILNKQKTLGYWFESESTDVSKEYTQQLISLIIDIVTAKLNDALNDRAEARSWISMKGKSISSRFLYIEAWRCWEQKACDISDSRAIATWEEIFVSADSCARMSIEARLSVCMSAIAREQGKVWAKYHPEEIRMAEITMSYEFEQQYETIEETAQQALVVIDDDSGEVSPTTKACCACWMRLHPEEMNVANDAKNTYLAELFKEQFPESTGEVCFKILNGWGNSEEMEWVEYADHWKSFNMDDYTKSSEALLKEMAADFSDKYPTSTYMEAAQIIEKNAVAQYIIDEEVQATLTVDPKDLLNANTWGTLHQGMLRKGKAILYKEFQGEVNKQWNELVLLTESFQKGSALFTTDNLEDRFLGFRNRLANKFAWMYGYICLQQDLTLKAINNHTFIDPIEKVLHRVRPTQIEKYKKQKDDEYLKEQKRLENLSESLLVKLSTWNTYFGLSTQISNEEYEN